MLGGECWRILLRLRGLHFVSRDQGSAGNGYNFWGHLPQSAELESIFANGSGLPRVVPVIILILEGMIFVVVADKTSLVPLVAAAFSLVQDLSWELEDQLSFLASQPFLDF